MNENDQESLAIAKSRKRQSLKSFGRVSEEDKPASRYTLFIFGLASFIAGTWAISCFLKAVTDDGPIGVLKKLSTALLGR